MSAGLFSPEDAALLATPIGYAEEVLKLPPGYPWQHKTVAPLEKMGWDKPIIQVSTLAPNEGGKSSWIVAGSALYVLDVVNGNVDITTKDQKQLNEQIIPAIESQIHKMPGFKAVRSPYYRVTNGKQGAEERRIIAYVTDDASRVEGMHGRPDAPLLKIVDEAKSVEEKIFDGINRCGYQAIIYVSSGGLMTGTFFDSHNKNRAHWVCIKAGLKDCPHISEAKVQRIIDKYGENHPFTRSCVYGEFMEQDDQDQFIFPHSAVMHALENPPKHRSGMRIGFVDFAEGTAEHVLAVRDGNKTEIALAFREANKHAACSRLIRGFMLAGLKEEQIWGDAADKEALDILVSLGWTIHRQNFGAPARNSEQFQSWSAESWIDASIGVSKGELIVPNDELLIAQLTSRKRTITGRGKLGAEEKYDMRKRGVESPDRGDAWCGANNVYDSQQLTKSPFSIPSDWMDQVERSQEHEAVAAMGGGWGL